MILQVQGVLKDAMGLTGSIAIDETPTTSEYTLALRTANVMIDAWATSRLLLRSTTPISFPLVVGQYTYTIGASGANITANKPIRVMSAYYRDQTGTDTAIDVIDIRTYNNLSDKDVSTGDPMYLSYDPGEAQQSAQKGAIYIYPVPSTADTMYMECDSYLTEFVNLSDTVTFEPAYYEALIYNLAIRLWRHFRDGSAGVPADIALIAHESLSRLRAMNSVSYIAGLDIPGKVGKYNIYTDQG